MSTVSELMARHHERLSGFPGSLEAAFEQGLRGLDGRLTPAQLQMWAETGVEMTALSLRSWEAASEYFAAGSQLPESATWDAIEALGREALTMAGESAPLGAAFLKAAPLVIAAVGPTHVRQWADLGRRLYKGNWKSSAIAGQFFEQSPAVFSVLRPGQAARLVLFIDELSRHSYELATACLRSSPEVLLQLPAEDRIPFLTFGVELAQTSWADCRLYFERGVHLLEQVHAPVRERYLLLAAQVARGPNRSVFQHFEAGAVALSDVAPETHQRIIELSERLAPYSPYAAMDFVTNVPQVLERIRMDELDAWHDAGFQVLKASHDGGEAYFRLQSTRAEDILDTLSARIELPKVGEILRLYCKALTGRNLSLQSSSQLTEKGIGWVDQERATTEGTTVFLPEVMERYTEKEDNFAAMKVFATHQAARIEFGSFDLEFGRPGPVFGNSRTAEEGSGEAVTDAERFFDLFGERQLAADLYTITEDARVDACIRREYGGIRRPLRRIQRDALGLRPDVRRLPLRQGFVENLVRASLDGRDALVWPQSRAREMGQGLSILERLLVEEATIEDSAEATMRLYRLAMTIPNTLPDEDLDWAQMDQLEMSDSPGMEFEAGELGGEGGTPQMGDVGEGDDEAYESFEDVDYRGDFKPELVQLMMKLREDAQTGDAGQQNVQQLTPEQLQELLDKSVEIDLDALMEGDLDDSTGQFLSNLMKEAGTPSSERQNDGNPMSDDSTGSGEDEAPLEQLITTYYYDEWDFRAQDYKPRWCAVKEAKLEEGEPDFYDEAIMEHAGLVTQTRKQFELMKPEMFRKIKRLRDGEDIELDVAIEWMVERRSGVNPTDKLYWRRNKIERDVAVAFLIDMSASTDEEINKREKRYDDDFDDDPRKYLSWWVSKRRQELSSPPKRIIDLEKESTVLLMTALETIGDQYGLYGFSGYGRDNVEYFVIKDFEEHLSDDIKRRLDKISPIRSTRMGPAIRHTTYKLNQTDAKVKILFLLSDGRPQDHGYGRDRTEKEYAIHDTKQAFNEAKRDGITPFALTVDRSGHDYLKTMCEDMGYEVVADIEALPSRLPALYRRLTE